MRIFESEPSRSASRIPDRRRYPRVPASEPTEIFAAEGGGSLGPGLIRDISPIGACVAVDRGIEVGRRVRFQCAAGAVTAIVRHCSPVPLGHLVGVEFCAPRSSNARDHGETFPAAW